MAGFDELLAPFDRAAFFGTHWGQRPIHIAGTPEKFAALPGLAALPSVLAGRLRAERWIPGQSAFVTGSMRDASGVHRSMRVGADGWAEAYNAGISLCFGPVDRGHDALRAWVDGFKRSTSRPGTIVATCYLTPPRSGSSVHFDRQHVFFVQVDGEKRWRYSAAPAWPHPPVNLDGDSLESDVLGPGLAALGLPPIESPKQAKMEEVVLRAGDVLYLPPGVWHEASTEASHSLHYTLSFEPLGAWEIVMAYLRMHLLRAPSWRRDQRYDAGGGSLDDHAALEAAAREMGGALMKASGQELAQFFAMIQGVDPDLRKVFMEAKR